MATLLNIIVFLSLTVGIYAVETCVEGYCESGCCGDDCCSEASSYSMDSGSTAGIIVAVVIVKVCFWMCCCYFVRRRRQTVLIQHVMSPQTTVSVNQSHTGYDQPRPMPYATPMPGQIPKGMPMPGPMPDPMPGPMPGPMPNGQYKQQQMGAGAPPPYEQQSAYPLPK